MKHNKKFIKIAKARVMLLCILPGNLDPLNFVGVICKHSSVISLTETWPSDQSVVEHLSQSAL
jgi:hypothetical protein